MTGYRRISLVFWSLTVIAIVAWSLVPAYVVGWDLGPDADAIRSMQQGHDPYADGVALLEGFKSTWASHPDAAWPIIYVYGPITLPLLRWIGSLPVGLALTGYWLLIAVGAAVTIWVGMRFIEEHERPVLFLLTPAAIFFPGLIQHDTLFSGNVAFILYGLIFGAAAVGWRKGRWGWYYAAILLAACFKAPMLAMLAIPLLSARRQWLPSGLTVAGWLVTVVVQWKLWPTESQNYLRATDRMFRLSQDFGSSPAGVLAKALHGRFPYQLVFGGTYLLYALPVLAILFYLSRRFFSGQISQERWIPIMLVGVLLLNPRIQEYDVAPMTVVMLLIAWRCLSQSKTMMHAIRWGAFLFGAANILAVYHWRATECVVLVSVFSVGVRSLMTAESHVVVADLVENDDPELELQTT